MSPSFLENAFVLSYKHPWQRLKKNDVVLVKHSHYGKMIKRIEAITDQGIWLVGDNPASVSTEKMGIITQKEVLGKVVWQVKPN